MSNDTKDIIEYLFNKYTFIWNHYKLQNECMEKRRYLFWVIESAILVVFYKLIVIGGSQIPIYIKPLIYFMVILLGWFISLAWLIVSIRDRLSIQKQKNNCERLRINGMKLKKLMRLS